MLLALHAAPLALPAQQSAESERASVVFRRFADRVVKIQVVETASAAKSSLGSGFLVSPRGHVITNYHVISSLVTRPGNYRGEMIDRAGKSMPITVLALDVINDVAVLGTAAKPAQYFDLMSAASASDNQGDRLFSMGHPHDLGLTIVEGTFNGLLQHTLYPKLHFTGSLNSGMSGGPTVSENGRVVGVNVSTAGDQVSFLVPAERARTLLSAVLAPTFVPSRDLLGEIARQLRVNGAGYTAAMFAPSSKTVRLGGFTLPTEPAPFFRCWGDATHGKARPYQELEHSCSTEDNVFISGTQSSGLVELTHTLYTSNTLPPLRLYALLESRFDDRGSGFRMFGLEEDFTSFECTTDNVRNSRTTMRVALCVRRYKRLPGLYDAVLRAVVLGARNAGVITTLTLTGMTFENLQGISRRYLERITWHE